MNRANIFTLTEEDKQIYYSYKDLPYKKWEQNRVTKDEWQVIDIDLPAKEYCKIVMDVRCKYPDFMIQLRNIELYYNTGEEKFKSI